jgi:uncharacterized SAM-binding protein YcdF (DUF218 family)
MDLSFRMGMRALLALIPFALLLLFLAPIATGIFNLGNFTGAVVSALLTAIIIFWDRFRGIVESLWQHPVGKAVVCVVSAFAVFCIITVSVISFFMIREMNDRPPDSNTTVVVLGCKVKDGAPSLMLKRRLDTAYEYLADEPDVKVIVSGGKGSDELISEAQCMRDYLVEKGIAPERIYMEDKSTDTDENLCFSKIIIESESLPEHITIVTDGFHQFRSDMKAEKLDINSYNISAKTPIWLLPTYWVREWYGVIYYLLKK